MKLLRKKKKNETLQARYDRSARRKPTPIIHIAIL